MSATETALYKERVGRVSDSSAIDESIARLTAGAQRLAKAPIPELIRYVQACIDGVAEVADEWVAAACAAKGIPPDSQVASEEINAGPVAVLRCLRLIEKTLIEVERNGAPTLPGKPRRMANGQLAVPVFPTPHLFDKLLFRGLKAEAWLQKGVEAPHARGRVKLAEGAEARVALVLGAGNVSSIAAADVFARLFQDRKAVLLKMNPVNEYLGPFFERAFRSLVDADYLAIAYGGAEVGGRLVEHPSIDEVHITGSIHAHQSIVWGPPGPQRDERMAANNPRLTKPITSELGNVTPWIVVPGPYTNAELNFQAENVASMILNNASFNCIAIKMIVTWRGWPDRQKFLDKVDAILARTPPRKAYYPGAAERFEKFARRAPERRDALPWTLVRDVDPDRDRQYFDEESFVCVTAETAIDADDEAAFLDRVAPFVNERLWGTLGVGLMVHPKTRATPDGRQRFQRCIETLRYGTVAINVWPGLSFALMSTPWGGYDDGTRGAAALVDPQSGVGWVHNTYLLDGVEKVVVEGPLTMFPKPVWFPSHRRSAAVSRRLISLYHRPSALKLIPLFADALRG